MKIKIRSEGEWIVYNDLFVDGEYDEAFAVYLEKPGGIVVDLGANVGFFALRLLHEARRRNAIMPPISYTGVEASAALCEEFNRRLSIQPDGLDWKVHNGLAGKRIGRAQYKEIPFHIGNRVVTEGGKPISYLNIDELVPSGEPIGLLKIDIEGSEEDFLSEYTELLGRTRLLVIELHHDRCDTTKCREKIKEAGLDTGRELRRLKNYTVEMFTRN